MKIQISEEYLIRESRNADRSIDWLSNKGETIHQWILNYIKRNKIQNNVVWYKYRDGSEEPQLQLEFKSRQQFQAFLRVGNQNFSYFEFI